MGLVAFWIVILIVCFDIMIQTNRDTARQCCHCDKGETMRGMLAVLAVVIVAGLWGNAGEEAGSSLEERIASLEKQNGELAIKLKILQTALKAYVQDKTTHIIPNPAPVAPPIYDTSAKDEVEQRLSSLEKLLGINKYSYGRHTGIMFGGSIPDRLTKLEAGVSSIQAMSLLDSTRNQCSCPPYIHACTCY